MRMRIAIDGPAGAGKSTVARAVADALGYTYLDSGAMYRAAAYKGDEHTNVEFRDGRVLADGEDVTEAIRLPEVTEMASELAGDPERRKVILTRQRELVADGDWVIEGRDAASAIAPDAEIKVFLTASPDERAKRRAAQVGGDWHEILEAQNVRDTKDNTLGRSVLEPADGAVVIDTTGLTQDEVVDRIVELL
ncbi:MAG: CMP/dCMP kinase [Solirubrobacteraceae bacterium]|jgi:cytidylate kinase|nr:CMP/dCMP kinase [Solirubrobacteraceae bacterium]